MFADNTTAHDLSYDEPRSSRDESWFVYLLPTVDYTVFKVGFSHNPLQRMHTFNRRFFERFDLDRSLLIRVASCRRAREIERALKKSLANSRAASPSWVEGSAGGDTEWYVASEFAQAQERALGFLPDIDSKNNAADFVRDALIRFTSSFELWAVDQARRLHDDWVAVNLGHDRSLTALTLRDWLDAYRFFDIELFHEDSAAFEFTRAAVRLGSY